MGRVFEILEESRKLHQEKYNCEGICPDFIKGVEWADSHPRKGMVDVKKACDAFCLVTCSGFGVCKQQNPCGRINAFRKAMLEEE